MPFQFPGIPRWREHRARSVQWRGPRLDEREDGRLADTKAAIVSTFDSGRKAPTRTQCGRISRGQLVTLRWKRVASERKDGFRVAVMDCSSHRYSVDRCVPGYLAEVVGDRSS